MLRAIGALTLYIRIYIFYDYSDHKQSLPSSAIGRGP
jgi:hypothetical protein